MPNQFHLAEEVASQRTQVENFEVERQENVFQRPHHLIKHNFKGLDEIALGLLVSKCPYADRLYNLSMFDIVCLFICLRPFQRYFSYVDFQFLSHLFWEEPVLDSFPPR